MVRLATALRLIISTSWWDSLCNLSLLVMITFSERLKWKGSSEKKEWDINSTNKVNEYVYMWIKKIIVLHWRLQIRPRHYNLFTSSVWKFQEFFFFFNISPWYLLTDVFVFFVSYVSETWRISNAQLNTNYLLPLRSRLPHVLKWNEGKITGHTQS